MKNERIEEVLRKAPAPKAPAGLLEKLTADIDLPRVPAQPTNWTRRPSWTRRWLPALSFAGLFLACVVAIAMQTNMLAELNRDNDQLRAKKENLDTLRGENVEYKKLLAENRDLERLRKDNLELLRLRTDAAKLQSDLGNLAALRTENQQLQAQAASRRVAVEETVTEGSPEEKARAERLQCVNNLKQVGLAARIWAGDNNDVYPPNFICMTNELSTWKILQCPSDKSHHVTNWAEVATGNISYIMVAPGLKPEVDEIDRQLVFVECPIHHSVAMMDGSVQQLSEESYKRRVKTIDGRKVLTQ